MTARRNAVVLLSGGQDSTTCLFWALGAYDRIIAVTLGYGQRHISEVEAAAEIAAIAGVEHLPLEVPSLAELGDSALTSDGELEATGGRGDREAPDGLPTSFVPGRNLIFLAIAGSVAVKYDARDIITGVSEADYSGYPDCRRLFIAAAAEAITLAMPTSSGPISIVAPLLSRSKAETVAMAKSLGPDCWRALGRSITCYRGQRPGCGACPSCELRAAGFAAVGEEDPACSSR